MNSIESAPIAQSATPERGDAGTSSVQISDLKALETLRSFIGNQADSNKEKDAFDSSGLKSSDPALMEALLAFFGPNNVSNKALPTSGQEVGVSGSTRTMGLTSFLTSEENVPASILPILNQVRESLVQGKGGEAPPAEAMAQIQGLIATLPASTEIPPGLDHLLSAAANQLPAAETHSDSDPTPPIEQPTHEAPNLGNAILQSLNNQSSTSSVNEVTSTHAPAVVERLEQVSALMTEMADRVLVTDPLHSQTPEVRIKLADNVMSGTEVRMWREDGGQLRVEFDTTSGYWARVLNDASTILTQRLNERLNLPDAALVTVNQQGDQPEDGRSRNRYTPWDLAQHTDDQ